MRRSAIFWGFLLLSLGCSILLIRHNILHADWEVVKSYWAIILILWGISVLLKETGIRWVFSALIACVLGFGIASVTMDDEHSHWNGHGFEFRWHDSNNGSDDEEECSDEDADESRHTSPQQDSLAKKDSSAVMPTRDSTKAQRPVY